MFDENDNFKGGDFGLSGVLVSSFCGVGKDKGNERERLKKKYTEYHFNRMKAKLELDVECFEYE